MESIDRETLYAFLFGVFLASAIWSTLVEFGIV